ncbi:preprotein translocase subunit SecE [Rhodococcus marinonascens]|uniref:preprotein translocase subunit SecE n=1 Tax=Rhodococcus marinonascens TaxID=38311 RepID=UPI000934141E|nr:preprotein translocase subunit SecE [Rhodococcus marinonascens]
MSEERAKRGGDTSGSTRQDGVEDAAADATTRSDAPSGKPSGKRQSRRSSAGTEGSVKSPERSKPDAATKVRPAKKDRAEKPRKENIFKRLRRFLREVIAELRKVIWPNRKQMITYTSVVLVFLVFMVTLIGVLDLAVIKGVTWLFD